MKKEALKRFKENEFIICDATFDQYEFRHELFVIMKSDIPEVMEEAWRYVKCHFGKPTHISYNLSPEIGAQRKVARQLIEEGRYAL